MNRQIRLRRTATVSFISLIDASNYNLAVEQIHCTRSVASVKQICTTL